VELAAGKRSNQPGRLKTATPAALTGCLPPYRPLRTFASEVRSRLSAAGVKPPGKSGPHIFRHARAVEMLRASVPQKIIGDVLGHRSTEATIPYLKLATEDLRAIALDVPGSEVLA
jgi:integrase